MIRNRIFRDGYIFNAAGGAGGFGKIDGLAFPKYIMFSFFYLVDIGLQLFIIPDRNGLPEFLISIYFIKTWLLSKFGVPSCFIRFFRISSWSATAVAIPLRIPLYIYEAKGFAKKDLIFNVTLFYD